MIDFCYFFPLVIFSSHTTQSYRVRWTSMLSDRVSRYPAPIWDRCFLFVDDALQYALSSCVCNLRTLFEWPASRPGRSTDRPTGRRQPLHARSPHQRLNELIIHCLYTCEMKRCVCCSVRNLRLRCSASQSVSQFDALPHACDKKDSRRARTHTKRITIKYL